MRYENLTNQEIGRLGEFYTLQFLLLHQVKILERNWRHRHYEIDLIGLSNNTLRFIEVKTSFSSNHSPNSKFNSEKRKHLAAAAKWYKLLTGKQHFNTQFDYCKIVGKVERSFLEYKEDVFFPGLEK